MISLYILSLVLFPKNAHITSLPSLSLAVVVSANPALSVVPVFEPITVNKLSAYLRFLRKPLVEPATSSAITSAASPAETIKSIYKSCSIVYVEPALNPTIDDSTSTLFKAACFTSISLSKLQFSIATTAVNNLVET